MMDTKEAIKELEDLTVDYGNRNEEQIARLDEAIDMAMEALRNLPNRLRQAMDTISRKDTIEAIQQHFNPTGEELPTELASVLAGVGVVIGTMPSAEPEKRTEERTKTHTCDYINRKDAIDAHYEYCNKHPDAGFPVWSLKILEDLPPAQPDVLACGEGELIAQPEIIQCKDCKHRDPEDHKCDCGHDIIWQLPRDDKWYCADAERKDG